MTNNSCLEKEALKAKLRLWGQEPEVLQLLQD